MSKPYTGTSDGVASAKRPGLERFVDLNERRWNFKNLGTLVVRDIKGKPGQMSVHSTGRACDISFGTNRAAAIEAMNWFVTHHEVLGIEEVHDYSGLTKKGCEKYGRGWRCNRAGKPAWKDYTLQDNAGSFSGTWIHVELTPHHADLSGDDYEILWRSLPKPIKK